MATYTHRTVTTTREEWVVPMATAHGIAIGEFSRAFNAAERAYREYYDLPTDAVLTDDALWIMPSDEDVAIGFETRTALRAI